LLFSPLSDMVNPMFWKKPSPKQVLPPPVRAAHGEYSMILSMHDEPSRPTPDLIDVAIRAAAEAGRVKLDLGRPVPESTHLWPGEHYRLLAGLVRVLKPKTVVEIGTATGLSALCMREHCRVVTFDVVPWHSWKNTVLREDDFGKQLVQHVGDLGQWAVMEKHGELMREAGLVFIDATHDGELEARLFENLERINYRGYVLMDDIRVWTMLKMWREIKQPKLDLTSFGHWSGTGLVLFR